MVPLLAITILFFALLIPFSFYFKTETKENIKDGYSNSIDYGYSKIIKKDNEMIFWNRIENNTLENAIIVTPEKEPPLEKIDHLSVGDLSRYNISPADFKSFNDSNFNREKMVFFGKIQNNFFKTIITLSENLLASFTCGLFSYVLTSIGYFLILAGLWPFAFFSSWKLLDLLFATFGFIGSLFLLNLVYSKQFTDYFLSKIPAIQIPELYSLIFSILFFILLQIFGFFVILTHKNREAVKRDEN